MKYGSNYAFPYLFSLDGNIIRLDYEIKILLTESNRNSQYKFNSIVNDKN